MNSMFAAPCTSVRQRASAGCSPSRETRSNACQPLTSVNHDTTIWWMSRCNRPKVDSMCLSAPDVSATTQSTAPLLLPPPLIRPLAATPPPPNQRRLGLGSTTTADHGRPVLVNLGPRAREESRGVSDKVRQEAHDQRETDLGHHHLPTRPLPLPLIGPLHGLRHLVHGDRDLSLTASGKL